VVVTTVAMVVELSSWYIESSLWWPAKIKFVNYQVGCGLLRGGKRGDRIREGAFEKGTQREAKTTLSSFSHYITKEQNAH
jgi:hypothetical protein